eukprot:CAMPEP_0202879564 /NCGR_PEP_ID=MMETSP1391-20130828/33797_1 /ASSEMBLY_ACC=CAM_ASM_000867 /TAXON_ID=1034604 /ORGANISM="Chlamydomonas leiostraca, Strain SAG 11-49" /LENGTH=112 /DNA_ID=CAMNT_0049561935 /DNA_START=56 /DNA_END=391 /DNA_ORIENTATION=-
MTLHAGLHGIAPSARAVPHGPMTPNVSTPKSAPASSSAAPHTLPLVRAHAPGISHTPLPARAPGRVLPCAQQLHSQRRARGVRAHAGGGPGSGWFGRVAAAVQQGMSGATTT